MASLSFIMDVPDDRHVDGRPPPNKRDQGAGRPASAGLPRSPSPPSPHADPRHATRPGQGPPKQDIKQAVPAPRAEGRGASSTRGPKSVSSSASGATTGEPATSAPAPSPSPPPPPSLAPTTRKSARRRKKTGPGSMDGSRYGSAAPSSSFQLGRGLQRPMRPLSAAPQLPARITPKTGRVSKAKKGLPVHVCEICRPPKTFTRAEHLRRHQLGHGAPQFQCPGCEKSFHRADLLARHQQKHEHDGDVPSRPESTRQSPRPSQAAPTLQARESPRSPNPGPTPSPALAETAPIITPAAGTQPGFSRLGNAGHGHGSLYGAAARGSPQQYPGAYALSPNISIVTPGQPSPLASHYQDRFETYQTRPGQPSIYVVTRDLPLPDLQQAEPPELHDVPSSASDSPYSTPVSETSRHPHPWARGRPSPSADWASSQRLSPYPSAAPRGPPAAGLGIDQIPVLQPPLYMDSYSSALSSGHAWGSALNPPSTEYATAPAADHHHQPQHPRHSRHDSSVSSVQGRTPPSNTDPQAAEDLMVSTAAIPGRLHTTANMHRRKLAGPMGTHMAMGALDLLGDLAVEYGANGGHGASPDVADYGSQSSGMVAELDLALGGGPCVMPTTPPSTTIPLPGPVRAAIPRYIEAYWALVDPLLPLVHRPSFETAAEDVLRCAMAAVAAQHLDNREDRTRGVQLHEFAWQELKRVPEWSLQTMQAILLCELFSRFRGRKAATRPSKPFESLYSRVLYQNPAALDHAMIATHQQHASVREQWQHWIDSEARRRLLAACIWCDGHAAVYQQQRRAQDGEAEASAALLMAPLLGRAARLWKAGSAEEWDSILADDPDAIEPEHVPPLEQLTLGDLLQRPAIDRMVILSLLAMRLPRRQRPPPVPSLSASNSPAPELDLNMQHGSGQFGLEHQHPSFLLRRQPHHPHHQQPPGSRLDAEERINALYRNCPVGNTYLALHHTPLRDLLAVAGDSWVFAQKVLPATSFHEHQRRLSIWVTSSGDDGGSTSSSGGGNTVGMSVVRATVHAARAILGFLECQAMLQPRKQQLISGGGSPDDQDFLYIADLSDYWALFVCALICWAFGHRACHGGARLGGGDGGGGGGGGGREELANGNHNKCNCSSNNNNNLCSSCSGTSSPAPQPRPPSAPSRPGNATFSSSLSSSSSSSAAAEAGASEDEAFAWLRMVAAGDAGFGEDTTAPAAEAAALARAPRATLAVVGLVRRRLESDCLGGRSRLYVDAVGVLRRVEEGVGRRWF